MIISHSNFIPDLRAAFNADSITGLRLNEDHHYVTITCKTYGTYRKSMQLLLKLSRNRPCIEPTDQELQYRVKKSEINLQSDDDIQKAIKEIKKETKDEKLPEPIKTMDEKIKIVQKYCKDHSFTIKENQNGWVIECNTEIKKIHFIALLDKLNCSHIGWTETKISTRLQSSTILPCSTLRI